jgi:tetratricopeptide (TPR) repeat protein
VYLRLRSRDPGNAQLATLARQARDRAARLIPTAPEAFLAQADFALSVDNDTRSAMRVYRDGLAQHPGDPELLTGLAYQLYGTGQIDSALVVMEKSSALDPRSPEGALGLAQAYAGVRRWPESDSAYVRAIALAPEQYHAYFERAQLQILWRGDTVAARKIMQTAEERIGRAEFVRKMCVACFDWTGALAAEYERVLDQLSLKGFSSRDSANYYGARADRAFMRGDAATNRVYSDSALRVIRPVLKANPKLRWAMFSLAYSSACLGDSATTRKALASAFQRTLEIGDTVAVRAWLADNWGWVLTRMGQREAAAESLKVAVSEPRYPYLTAKALSVSPYYARLRGVPVFDRLIAGP